MGRSGDSEMQALGDMLHGPTLGRSEESIIEAAAWVLRGRDISRQAALNAIPDLYAAFKRAGISPYDVPDELTGRGQSDR